MKNQNPTIPCNMHQLCGDEQGWACSNRYRLPSGFMEGTGATEDEAIADLAQKLQVDVKHINVVRWLYSDL